MAHYFEIRKKIVSFAIDQIRNIGSKGFFHLLSANMLIQIVGFGSQIFIAWILNPIDIGRLKIWQTFLTLLIIIGGMGFNVSILKICSEKRTLAEKINFFREAYKYTTVSCILIYIISLLASKYRILSSDNQVNSYFPFYSLLLFPQVFANLDIAFFQAVKEVKSLAKIQTVTKLITLVLIVIFTFYFKLDGYIISLLCGLILTNVLLYKRIYKLFAATSKNKSKSELSTLWKYAKYAVIANVVNQLCLFPDLLLINYLIKDKSEVGYYGFALTIMISLQTITATIQQIATPYFSEKANDIKEWYRIYQKYNRIFVYLSAVILFCVVFLSPLFITFIFKNKYDSAIIYFQLLSVSWFIKNLYSIKGIALLGIGKINLNMIAVIISLPVVFTITYIMIVMKGIQGAAYGNILGNISTYLIVTFQFRKFWQKNMTIVI